jgi:predicted nucleotidyltransferase
MDPAAVETSRNALLARATQQFLLSSDTVALFLAGSLANGTADAWSDIDLRVVVEDHAFASVVAERREVARTWGDWLFEVWDPANPSYCVSHFRPLVKIDVFYYRTGDLTPSPWYAQPLRVLHDPRGVVAEVVARSRALPPLTPSADMLRVIAGKAVAHLHELWRRIQRGEWLYAQSLLCALRDHVVRLDDAIAARPSSSAPVAHFERDSSWDASLSGALRASLACNGRDELLRALAALAGALRARLEAAQLPAGDIARYVGAVDLIAL